MRQAAGVVFPMPMSPVTRRSTPPLSTSSSATPAPAITARAASSRLIAGPRLRSSVPRRTFAARSRGCLSNSPTTPTSRTLTLAPTVFAMAFTAAPPVQKLLHHRRRNRLGPRRDAAFEDAVVPGTDNHGRALRDGRRALTCHPGEPRTELLQPSQTTRAAW